MASVTPPTNYTLADATAWPTTITSAVNSVIPGGYIPRVRASLTGAFAVSAATITDVNWNSEILDTDTIHSTSTNTSRLTVPSGLGGVWFFGYNVQFGSASAAGDRQAWVTVTGGGTRYASSLITTQTAAQNATLGGSGFAVLADGDYLQLKVYTAQALNINPVGVDYFEMCRIGPS